jgi:DNA-binding transcriptional regulator/RsmH inhibitor MraZ
LYPKDVWDKEMLRALDGEILDERITLLNEKFRIGKTEMQLDGKQGRVKLDKLQLSFAGINKEVVAYQAQKGFWVLKNPKFVK